jgi:hypothetical protein
MAHPGGRPTKYDKKYCKEMVEFFNIEAYRISKIIKTNKDGSTEEREIEVANDLPLFSKFAVNIGVHRDTLHEWKDKHEEFSDAYKKCKEIQRNILIINGLRGLYQTAFAIFTAKNITDLRDKQEIEHSGETTIRHEVSFRDDED